MYGGKNMLKMNGLECGFTTPVTIVTGGRFQRNNQHVSLIISR
jgi:hypothetical protein